MAEFNPFRQSDFQEIRQIALILFDGGNPEIDDEINNYYKKWKWWFELFYLIIDRENGNFIKLPFETDAVNQPHKTIQIIKYIQSLWIDKLVEEKKR